MAVSTFQTEQYTSAHFVESAGVVLLETRTRKVCLVHYKAKDEWLLPKGRRNVCESRQSAALREAKEETGYTCAMLAVEMVTRAPPPGEDVDDIAYHHGTELAGEPFMVTMRHLHKRHVKVIWWYVAAIDMAVRKGDGEALFEPGLFSFEEALSAWAAYVPKRSGRGCSCFGSLWRQYWLNGIPAKAVKNDAR
ncbi:hypothetical protein LTR08_008476 [Meristemomyces frigidus]|nr:hypothetical protein LTR08_008476 [Meristemomyces frigidus]